MELLAFTVEDAWEARAPAIQVQAETLDDQVVQTNGPGCAEELEERILEVLDESVPCKSAFGRLGLSNVRRELNR